MSEDVIDAFGHREFIRSCTNYVNQLGLSAEDRDIHSTESVPNLEKMSARGGIY